jgi:hypothetical protein
MSILNIIAYFQNRRDEIPNQELVEKLVVKQNTDGIRKIVST